MVAHAVPIWQSLALFSWKPENSSSCRSLRKISSPNRERAAQQGVAADQQQRNSIDLGCHLAAYWVGKVVPG